MVDVRETGVRRLLLCQNPGLIADTFAIALRATEGVSLVADPVDTTEAAVDIAMSEIPDVALIDANLGSSRGGIDTARRLRDAVPEMRILIMSQVRSDERVLEAFEAGALGLIHQSESFERVMREIEQVARGEALVKDLQMPELLERTSKERAHRADRQLRLSRLTRRERQVLALARSGARNEEIARQLFISARTVETHIQNALRKLDVHSRLEAIALLSDEDGRLAS